jgi:hypothetical protein
LERRWLDEELEELGEGPCTDDEWNEHGDPEYTITDASDWREVAAVILAERTKARRARKMGSAGSSEPTRPEPNLRESLAFDEQAWNAYRRRVFAPFAGRAQKVRAMLGLTGPIPPESVAELLLDAVERQHVTGEALRLEVPEVMGEEIGVQEVATVYRGETEEHPQRQPLGYLAGLASIVGGATGQRQVDAVIYLLSDVVIYWLPVRAVASESPVAGRPPIVLEIEWPFIEPSFVAKFYTLARGHLFRLKGDATEADRMAVGKRFQAAELVHFIDLRRHFNEPWSAIHDEWNDAYPTKAYKTIASMRRSYEEAKRHLPEVKWNSLTPWSPQVKGRQQ